MVEQVFLWGCLWFRIIVFEHAVSVFDNLFLGLVYALVLSVKEHWDSVFTSVEWLVYSFLGCFVNTDVWFSGVDVGVSSANSLPISKSSNIKIITISLFAIFKMKLNIKSLWGFLCVWGFIYVFEFFWVWGFFAGLFCLNMLKFSRFCLLVQYLRRQMMWALFYWWHISLVMLKSCAYSLSLESLK